MISLIGLLLAFSPLSDPPKHFGFYRNIKPGFKSSLLQKYEITNIHSPYIAGIEKESLYIGDRMKPFQITEINIKSSRQVKRIIRLDKIDSINAPTFFQTTVDSNKFILYNGVSPVILSGNTNDWIGKKIKLRKIPFFVDATPVSPTTTIVRSLGAKSGMYQIGKINLNDTARVRLSDNILKKQIDGILCVTGKILYSKETNKIIYLYTLRNKYIVLDTTLEIIGTGNTIDTFSIAPIKVSKIKNESVISNPRFVVNGPSTVYKNRLIIQSGLLAKNENPVKNSENTVLDIYSIADQKYYGSIYIPLKYKNRFSDFRILKNELIGIAGNEIYRYKLTAVQQDFWEK